MASKRGNMFAAFAEDDEAEVQPTQQKKQQQEKKQE
jgi:hypothetical protein